MNDYISREAAIKAIQAVPEGNWNNQRYVNEIERVPAADVVERKHGEWISVKERMPKDGQEVIAFTKDEIIGFMDYRGESSATDEWWTDDFGNALRYDDVTHWMPLPELPKEES